MADLVTIEEDGAIATITVNRPEKLNALDANVLSALHAAVAKVRESGINTDLIVCAL